MKKAISAVVTAAMCVTSLSFSATAAETVLSSDTNSIVLFGDSIASGYSRTEGQVEYNYGEICADYLGYDAKNFAVPGADTSDLLNLIAENQNAIDAASEAEIIVISIGGNNLIDTSVDYMLKMFVSNKLLKDGYTAENIPENISVTDILAIVDRDKLKAYFTNASIFELSGMVTELRTLLRGTNNSPGGCLYNEIIPETEQIIKSLRSCNPDAQIIVQTVYQPMQLSPEFIDANFGEDAPYASYSQFVDMAKNLLLKDVIDKYSAALYNMQSELAETNDSFDIADVYADFTSLPAGAAATESGNAHYFLDIESSLETMDFHPNQKGHLAIAATVLDTTGLLPDADSSCLIKDIYEKLEDKDNYPSIALERYNRVVAKFNSSFKLGDVNLDNFVDASDASLVLRNYALTSTGNTSEFDELQTLAADVNKDLAVDASDASTILGYYAFTSTGGSGTIEDYMNK